MPGEEKTNERELRLKLKRFVDCILEEAANNPAFATRLETALDSGKITKGIETKRTRDQGSSFNAVGFLKEKGKESLREELRKKDKGELVRILKAAPGKKGKGIARMEHAQLVEEIVQYAETELSKGNVFLGSKTEGKQETQAPDVTKETTPPQSQSASDGKQEEPPSSLSLTSGPLPGGDGPQTTPPENPLPSPTESHQETEQPRQ